MERVAQIFYNENYVDENPDEDSIRHKKINFKIFTKAVTEDIENCDKFTIVLHTDNNDRNKNIISNIVIDFSREISPKEEFDFKNSVVGVDLSNAYSMELKLNNK